MGTELNSGKIFTPQFVDDQVIIANEIDLVEEYNIWGLTVNLDKTKYLCVDAQPNSLNLKGGKKILHGVYLGLTFDYTGTDTK